MSSCVCSQRGFGRCSLRPKANPALKTSIYFWQTAKFHFDHTNRRTSSSEGPVGLHAVGSICCCRRRIQSILSRIAPFSICSTRQYSTAAVLASTGLAECFVFTCGYCCEPLHVETDFFCPMFSSCTPSFLSHLKNSTSDKPIPLSIDSRVLYTITCIVSAFIHIRTTMTAWSSLNPEDQSSTLRIAKTAWEVLHSNYAQSSIGWDLIWTTVSFIAWITVRPALVGVQRSKLPCLLLATPVASIGITAAYVLQTTTEGESDENLEGEKED